MSAFRGAPEVAAQEAEVHDVHLPTGIEIGARDREGRRGAGHIAPEHAAPGQIQQLTSAGVVVCAGHTDAHYESVVSALKEGLSGFTHLYNAMRPTTGREPGVVGAALEDANSWCTCGFRAYCLCGKTQRQNVFSDGCYVYRWFTRKIISDLRRNHL